MNSWSPAAHLSLVGTTLASNASKADSNNVEVAGSLRLAEQFVQSFSSIISTEVTARKVPCFSGALDLRERATWRATWIHIFGPAAIRTFKDFVRRSFFLFLVIMGVQLAWIPSFER